MPALAGRDLKHLAQQLPAPSANTLAELAAVVPFKGEAFNAWSPGQTWFAWCSTTGSTVTMSDSAWTAWNASVTTTSGSLAYSYSTGSVYVSNGTSWTAWNAAYQETAEQREERQRQAAEANARWAAEQEALNAARETAQARALELLKSLLTDAQWASYQENGWFEVRGSSGRRWRVRNRGQAGNVDLMPEIGDVREATYCAHPPDHLPDADAHAAQLLALVTDDEAFVRTANRHYPRAA